MTVQNENYHISYVGNGVTKKFAFPYPFLEPSDLEVHINDIKQLNETDYTLERINTTDPYSDG